MTENENKNRAIKASAIIYNCLPIFFEIVLIIGTIGLLWVLVPVVEGDVELEKPLTNSQLTAMLALFLVLYVLKNNSKIIKKLWKK